MIVAAAGWRVEHTNSPSGTHDDGPKPYGLGPVIVLRYAKRTRWGCHRRALNYTGVFRSLSSPNHAMGEYPCDTGRIE